MNCKRITILFVLVATFVLLAWWLVAPPTAGPTTQQVSAGSSPAMNPDVTPPTSADPSREDEERKAVLGQIEWAFKTPIVFYGRVIDNHGEPVPYATIGYTAIDKFLASGSNYQGQADHSGFFEITGIQGAAISVSVKKGGYYFIDETDRSSPSSSATFAYGMGADSYRRPAPTKNSPALFVLHKMGEPVPLSHVSSRQIDVPPTGQAVTVNLATGRTGQGDIEISSAVGDISQQPFDWRYQLSVPGGGLVERVGQFDFIAPVNGYQPTVEVNVSAREEKWSSRLTKEYFAKLEDGRFARFSIRFYAGNRNFIVMESYVNTTPGNRNLEYDPKNESGVDFNQCVDEREVPKSP